MLDVDVTSGSPPATVCPAIRSPAALGADGTVAEMLPETVEDACGDEPGSICEWVYEQSDGNETLAKLADWFVSRPLQIIVILLFAWIASHVVRRFVVRGVYRLVAPESGLAEKQFERLGIEGPALLGGAVHDPRRETRALAISNVVAGTAVVLVWTIALITIADRIGLALGPLIASAGIAGVALGFGAQSLVKDWIAGLFMLLEDQYGIGDVVDLGEATGTVERFSLRATVLRGADGTVWHVPNGEVVRVGNLSQLWSVAILDVAVAYDTDLDRARTLLHETATEVCERDEFRESILESPEVLGVEALGIDGITLRLTVKTTPGKQWAVQRALREAVKQTFERGGVDIPFPQRTVWMRMRNDDPPQPGRDEHA
jgi:small-conductance mechanosensitive channel